MAKLTKNKLRERRVFNEYELGNLQDEPKVWFSFIPQGDWRSMVSSGWYVHRLGYNTDGLQKESKSFIHHGREDKEPKRLEAMAWASERYNIHEWERSPFGSYHPVGTLARAAALTTEAN